MASYGSRGRVNIVISLNWLSAWWKSFANEDKSMGYRRYQNALRTTPPVVS